LERRRIHLIAPAGALSPFLDQLAFDDSRQLVEFARSAVGPAYDVTADENILTAQEDEQRGGRTDDVARARDIEDALRHDETAAIVALRGGAWLTRILPRIDFAVLDERPHPVAMIGFSELTTLVNIVGSYAKGLGIYDLSPAFLTYGLRKYAANLPASEYVSDTLSPADWARAQVKPETAAFFRRLVAMIEGRSEAKPIACSLVRGTLDDELEATFVGGNLTVLSTLVGSRYERCIDPTDRWIMIEDFNDKPERIDRFLAHFTLADFWNRCAGLLLGDFHLADRNLLDEVLAMLEYHLPDSRAFPVLTTDCIGHTWPMSPLPLHRPLRVSRCADTEYLIQWPADLTRVI